MANKSHEMPRMTEADIALPPGWFLKRYVTSDATIYGAGFTEQMPNRDWPADIEGIWATVQWHVPKGIWFGETEVYTPDAQRLQGGRWTIESHDINAVIADAVVAVEEARRWITETMVPSRLVEFEHEGRTVKGEVFLGETPESLRVRLPIKDSPRFETVTVPRESVRFILPEPSPVQETPALEPVGPLTQLTLDDLLQAAGTR